MHALPQQPPNHSHPWHDLFAGASQALPSPPPSNVHNDRVYCLEVVQQPVHARMSGLRNKSRRLISPSPYVRLTVIDVDTLRITDVSEVDVSSLVLTVELCDKSGTDDLNLIRYHPLPAIARIGMASATSYNSVVPRPMPSPQPRLYEVVQQQLPPLPSLSPPAQWQHSAAFPVPSWGYAPGAMMMPATYSSMPSSVGRFTRNLVGNLCANAIYLSDLDGEPGVWFILQDLSVRLMWILQMDLVDVSTLSYLSSDSSLRVTSDNVPSSMRARTATPGKSAPGLNNISAPVLATNISDIFHVYPWYQDTYPQRPPKTKSDSGVVTGSDIISEA